MLLVVLAYVLSSISGMGLPGHVLGGHAAAEMLHLPNTARALGLHDTGSQAVGAAGSQNSGTLIGLADSRDPDPAATLLLLPISAQNVAVIAYWLALAIGWLDQRIVNQTLVWSNAPEQSGVSRQCHRSVVLHI